MRSVFIFLFGLRRIKNEWYKQTVRMEKIKIFEDNGKTRDERETCFPSMQKNGKRRTHVRVE